MIHLALFFDFVLKSLVIAMPLLKNMVSDLPDVHSKMYDVQRTAHMNINLDSVMIVCCRLFSAITPHIHTLYRRNEDR